MATYNGNGGNNTYNGTNGNDVIRGYGGNDTLKGADGNDFIDGGTGNDNLIGGRGDDTVYGGGGTDVVNGWGGNDYLRVLGATGLTGIYGQQGDDTLVGSVPGGGQIHMGGGTGNDTLILDVTNTSGHQGHHVYGNAGADIFHITNTSAANSPILGRIDDFDASQDEIWIDGHRTIWFENNRAKVDMPSGAKVVEYLGQQWLKIGNTVLYALEGARDGGTEQHFSPFPTNIGALPTRNFIDQQNFVQYRFYETRTLNVVDTSAPNITGTSGDDLIEEYRVDRHTENGHTQTGFANSNINAGAGRDVVNAGKGDDTVRGGDGHDSIAGGMDEDSLFGDAGNDRLYGGSENDYLNGGDGNDLLYGGTGNDKIIGGRGNDRAWGSEGNDMLSGWGGNDKLYGQNGNDRLYGNQGNDRLYGQNGNDKLYGSTGNDYLDGGNNTDVINGGAGRDTMKGGGGNDTFEFKSGDLIDWDPYIGTTAAKHQTIDVITDFKIGQDTILFNNFNGVSDRGDLGASKYFDGSNQYFQVWVRGTNEQVLVDVAEGTSWGQFFTDANFDFA